MSAAKIIFNRLAASAGLIAVVPATSHHDHEVPVDAVLPALAVSEISTFERRTVSMSGSTVFTSSRVQVMVQAKTKAELVTILELVRLACPNQSGTVAGIALDSILTDAVGPDFKIEDAGIFMRSRDFLVGFNKAF